MLLRARLLVVALASVIVLLLATSSARADEQTAAHLDQRTTLRGVAWTGGQLGRVFDITTHSLQIAAGFETRGRTIGVLILPELDLGQTSAGVPSRRLGLTVALMGHVGPFSFGGGAMPVFDWLGDGRAIGIGGTLLAHGDILPLGDDRALFLAVRGDLTTMHGVGGAGANPLVVTASAGLGVRF